MLAAKSFILALSNRFVLCFGLPEAWIIVNLELVNVKLVSSDRSFLQV